MRRVLIAQTGKFPESGEDSLLDILETFDPNGRYNVVLIEPCATAYSRIKSVQPHLVVLCTRIEDTEAFDLLTMLKLDPETAAIPVLTYTTEEEAEDSDETEDGGTQTSPKSQFLMDSPPEAIKFN